VPAPVASTLTTLASAISSTPLTPPDLTALASTLNGIDSQLPSLLGGLVSAVSARLLAAGSLAGGTTGGTVGGSTGGTSGGTGRSTSGGGGSTTGGRPGGSSGSATGGRWTGSELPSRFAWGLLKSARRSGDRAIVTLYCLASTSEGCTTTLRVSEQGFRTVTRTVHLRRGQTARIMLTPRAIHKPATRKNTARSQHPRRVAIHLILRSGAYRATKTM
jgi:hypothetical protein